MADERTWTYVSGEDRYNVDLLGESARRSYQLLAKVTGDITELTNQISVLQAAAIQLNSLIQNELTADALITPTEERKSGTTGESEF
tara:strand:+ start:948 stop:1208 length:261 start_codon:yes stop_codon:yes gene_type:complete